MDIISVISQKGGSGKTTLVLHLAIAATRKKRVVSVIDLDPQKSAEQWWQLRVDKAGENDPAIASGPPANLGHMLEVARKEKSNLVIIDTPPQSDRAMIYAADVAQTIVVPTRCSVLDQFALKDTLELLTRAKAIDKCVVLVNAARHGDDAGLAAVRQIVRPFGVTVVKTVLEDLPDLGAALDGGLGIIEFDAKGQAARDVEAIYRYLTRKKTGQRRSSSRRRAT